MFRFFQDGFYRDFIILILVTIIIGSVFSSGIAWAVNSYFDGTIEDVIGDNGEYDLILHVRESSKEAALRELERIAEQQYQGSNISQTITVAGQANFLFGFSAELRTEETFSRLASVFSGVPGLNSYTVIIEPSLLVRGVHPSVAQELQHRFNQLKNVNFAFRDGQNMLVVLDSAEHSRTVMNDVKQVLKDYQVLEVRFPIGLEIDVGQNADAIMAALRQEYRGAKVSNVSAAEYGEELDALLKTLVEMRSFLLSYASSVKINLQPNANLGVGEEIIVQGMGKNTPQVGGGLAEDHVVIEVLAVQEDFAQGMIVSGSIEGAGGFLNQPGYRYLAEEKVGEVIGDVELENERYRLNYTINESLRLLEELDDLAIEAGVAVDNADAVLTTFQEALMQLEVLQVQMQQLNAGLSENGAQSTSEQLIISLFLSGLLKNIAKSGGDGSVEAGIDSLENLDVASMRASIANIAEQISNVQEIDVQAIIDQISDIRDSLPQLDDADIGKSIHLIDNYIGGQVIPGERIQILVENMSINEDKAEDLIRKKLDNKYLNTYSIAVGTVNPDTRTEVFRILKEVRSTIAGIMSIVFVAVILILDHATIVSTLKWIRSNKKITRYRFARYFNPLVLMGGLVGMVLLVLIYVASRASIPYVSLGTIAIVGGLLGMTISMFSEKFSPIHADEIMAGQALGLSNVQIMQEIVIPASRPGLLNLLNRTRQRF